MARKIRNAIKINKNVIEQFYNKEKCACGTLEINL
jgi:hypothetical protein